MKTCIAIISTSVLSLIALNAANAADFSNAPKSRTVRFADLDLSTVDGAATLYNRLRSAARGVCSPLRGGPSLRDKQQYADCIDFALSNAIAKVDHPVVTEFFASKTGGKSRAPERIASER